MHDDDKRVPADETGRDEQTWGQGEGRHEPTIEPPTSSAATERDDADRARAHDEEGTDR